MEAAPDEIFTRRNKLSNNYAKFSRTVFRNILYIIFMYCVCCVVLNYATEFAKYHYRLHIFRRSERVYVGKLYA
jgi:hypothetical protein